MSVKSAIDPSVEERGAGEPSALDPVEVQESLRRDVRESERLLDALRPLGSRGLDNAPVCLREVAGRLRRLRPGDDARADLAERLAHTLAGHADALEDAARTHLLDGLRAAAAEAGLPYRRLSDDPLEVGLGPLEVSLPPRGEATLRLGREEVVTADQDPDAIVRGVVREIAAMKENLIPSAEFFDLLSRAWRMAVAARGPSPDGRVDLVDLLLPLALLELGPDQWRRARAERGVTPWPRYRLAYQLYRLRRERHLVGRGQRLELAAATLATTRDTRNVLHVLDGDGRGQYYGAVRFVPEAATERGAGSPSTTTASCDTPGAPHDAAGDAPTCPGAEGGTTSRQPDRPAQQASVADASDAGDGLHAALDLFRTPEDP